MSASLFDQMRALQEQVDSRLALRATWWIHDDALPGVLSINPDGKPTKDGVEYERGEAYLGGHYWHPKGKVGR